MRRHLLRAVIGLGLVALTAAAAAAKCGERDVLIERLQTRYSEKLTARGLQEFNDGAAIIEIWASEDTGTFTILLTNAEGSSCIVAAGSHWFEEAPPEPDAQPKGTPS